MDHWTKFILVLFLTYILALNYLSSDNISIISQLASNYEIIKVKIFCLKNQNFNFFS